MIKNLNRVNTAILNTAPSTASAHLCGLQTCQQTVMQLYIILQDAYQQTSICIRYAFRSANCKMCSYTFCACVPLPSPRSGWQLGLVRHSSLTVVEQIILSRKETQIKEAVCSRQFSSPQHNMLHRFNPFLPDFYSNFFSIIFFKFSCLYFNF